MKVFCIIPVYNEEENIEKVIDNLKPYNYQVVVVDDCSLDDSYKLAKDKGVIVLRHLINRGQGAALQTGNQYALKKGADIVIHFDGDNQFLASEVPDILEPIMNNQADIVFGSRFLDKKSTMPILKRKILMPLATLINKMMGIKTSDPQIGLRALNRLALQKINIENDGMAHCSEILFKAHKSKLRIKEVPVTVIYHRFGNNFSGGLKIIKDLLIKKVLK
jgi:polyprenyl-phospho-N-acetylgalactosaminyl synthase